MPSGGERRDPLRQQLLPAGEEVLRRRVHPVRNVLGEVQLRLEGDLLFRLFSNLKLSRFKNLTYKSSNHKVVLPNSFNCSGFTKAKLLPM
jgi:hypothetical protein